ncbi:unnamed protein product [Urochloa humidicola]
MDDEWWKKAKMDIPGCGKFKKKPLQNEDLSVMFGDIINGLSDNWNPMSSNSIIPPSQENIAPAYVNEVPDDCDNDVGDEDVGDKNVGDGDVGGRDETDNMHLFLFRCGPSYYRGIQVENYAHRK